MENFEFWNPTRVIFGQNQLHRLPELLHANNATKILLVYGGGSIKSTGLFNKIVKAISDFELIEFGGVEANPEYTTLMKAAELGRKEQINFILAVGGGSVIDGVKFISGAINYEGNEPWDVLEKKENCAFSLAVPFGTILTLPATGSEVNSGAVVSRSEWQKKRVMGGPQFFPKFSFCDPSLVATLPKRQLSNGVVDAFMHTLEQYLTTDYKNYLQEREAEAILATLIQIKEVVNQPQNYELAYNFMLCASHALNGNLRSGAVTDWTTHMIGHELTAFYGIDHAQSLAIIAPRLFEHELDRKQGKLAQFGRRIWQLEGTDEEVAINAIQATDHFFQELGVKTRIRDYTTDHAWIADKISAIFLERGWTEMGEHGAITPQDVKQIVEAAI